MNIRSFADELIACREPFTKVARSGSLVERGLGWGTAIGAGGHLAKSLKAQITGNPWDAPQSTLGQSTARGATGGLSAAAILGLLARMGKKGKG